MPNLPLIFTYAGKQYDGELTQVQGAGGTSVYHLMIQNYYCGRLRFSAFNNRWVFDGEFEEMAEGFGILLSLSKWVKTELEQDEEQMFFHLFYDAEIESIYRK
jgi:hypothetical protein